MAPSIHFEPVSTNSVLPGPPAHRRFAVLANKKILTAVKTAGTPPHIQIWQSEDNGETWTVIHDDTTTTNGYPGPLLHWPDNTIVACFCDAADFVSPSFTGVVRIKRSTDAGNNWTTVQTLTPGNTTSHINELPYDGVTFTKSGAIIMGFFTQASGSTTKDSWRSTDKGASWAGPTRINNNLRASTYSLGITNASGTIFVSQGTDVNAAFTQVIAPTIRKSTNHGATFSNGGTVPLLNGNTQGYEFGRFCAFDASIILLGGNVSGGAGTTKAPLWRTTDGGTTWAVVSQTGIDNWSPANNFPVIDALARLTANVGILAYSQRSGGDPVPWRLTHDAGATFPISATASSTPPTSGGAQSSAFCKTPNGHVLAWYTSNSGTGLWRGEITC